MGRYIGSVEDHLILPVVVSLTSGEERRRRQAGRRMASPVPVRLLIDTGAKRTTLIPGLIRHLDPSPGLDVTLVTPSQKGTSTLYWVQLAFPLAGRAPFDPIQVVRLAMPPELAQFHGLLGRDLLRSLESFLYEGRRGCYTLRDRPGPLGWLRRWL